MEFNETDDGVPHVPPAIPLSGEVSFCSEDDVTETGGGMSEEISTENIGVDPELVVGGGDDAEPVGEHAAAAAHADAEPAPAEAGLAHVDAAAEAASEQPATAGVAETPPELAEAGLEITSPVDHEGPVVARLVEPIESNGAADAHSEFDLVGTEEVRERVADAAEALVKSVQPGIEMDDVLVSCFGEGYEPESMDSADEHKLSKPSSVPEGGFVDGMTEADDFHGDDSNTHNLLARDMQVLRNERSEIGKAVIADDEMRARGDGGILTADERAEILERTREINQEIEDLKERVRTEPNVPVYYTTPFDDLRNNEDGEDNPLGYAGDMPEPGDEPTRTFLAFYDRKAIEAAGLPVTEKSEHQVRVAGTGRQVMPHCLAVMEVAFTGTERAEEPEEW